MEFHQLRYFVAAAEEGNITRAAARVHVSQPAMSRQIALLEDELGVALFDRIRKRIQLTPAGRFFLEKSRQLLCDAELGVQQVRERFGGERRTLRLGFITPFLDDLVTPVVREFRQRHPLSQVSLFDLPPRSQIERLKAHELDAGILGNLTDDERPHFQVKEISRHKFVAVVPEDHPMAGRRTIKLSALANEKWISLSNTAFPGRREFLMETCGKAGFTPKIEAELDSLPLMLATIATGGGVGIMPDHAAKLPHAGCVLIALSAPVVRGRLFLVLPKAPPGKEMAGLIALLEEEAGHLSSPGT